MEAWNNRSCQAEKRRIEWTNQKEEDEKRQSVVYKHMVHWTRKSGWCDFGKGNEASKESSASLAKTVYAKRTQRLRYPDPEVVFLCSRTFQFSEVSCQELPKKPISKDVQGTKTASPFLCQSLSRKTTKLPVLNQGDRKCIFLLSPHISKTKFLQHSSFSNRSRTIKKEINSQNVPCY